MKNKVVLITGGIRGIGLAIAKIFLKHGAKVVLNYRNDYKQAEITLNELNAESSQILLVQADLNNVMERESLLSKVLLHFHKVDVLINNAGIASKAAFLKS